MRAGVPNDQKLAGKYIQACIPKIPVENFILAIRTASQSARKYRNMFVVWEGVWRQDCEQKEILERWIVYSGCFSQSHDFDDGQKSF